MILHTPRKPPGSWRTRRDHIQHGWLTPFIALEWTWEWAAFVLSNWAFLEVLEYLSSFSVLIAVIFYFSESGDRVKARHYQAWQVINTAQGKGGSGGRIEALQELNEDKVPLVGVDVSSAYLQGLRLEHASLVRANFNAADLRRSDLAECDLTLANLSSANFRSAALRHVLLANADLHDADLNDADLEGADLSGAMLNGADLRHANLANIRWQQIRGIRDANIAGVTGAPAGFLDWARANGAIELPGGDQ
ncbi:pentapeptide repeat-containing protein [Acidobacteria bacterium AB60]|nr:pentapeptide repeat-containing protein [Acidobacteria bacterium AB60]